MHVMDNLATHIREVYTGNNWTDVNMSSLLSDVSLFEANQKIGSLHTIAELVFHINYFIKAVTGFLQTGEMKASDKFSFNLPAVETEEQWKMMLNQSIADAEYLATIVKGLSDDKINEVFVSSQYRTYYYNLAGLSEHTHYHMGQIAILKKLIRQH